MRFRGNATLDPSQVSDRRGMGMGGLALGGGGGVVALVFVLIQLLSGGGSASNFSLGGQDAGDGLATDCQTGADANQRGDCRIVAVVNSVQALWASDVP